MRRKDRERDRSFAWEVLKKAPYATLSLTDGQGRPYAVPVNQAVDEEYHVVYFHCAGADEHVHNFQSLLTSVWLRDQKIFRVHTQFTSIIDIQSVFRIHESDNATFFLSLSNN